MEFFKHQIFETDLMHQESGKLIGIKLVDFKKNEADKFSYLLDLAEFGLLPLWQVVDTETADYYLLSEKPITHNFKGLPRERCLFYKDGPSTDKENAVRIDAERTPGIQSLIKLLNRLSAQVLQETPVVGSAIPLGSTVNVAASPLEDKPAKIGKEADQESYTFFNPHQGLLKHLLTETTNPVLFKLKAKSDHSPIYVYPEKRVFYCKTPLGQLDAYFESNSVVSVTPVTAANLSAAVKKPQLPPQPLAYLIWFTAFKLSNGTTMLGHSTKEFIRLKSIPFQGVGSESYMKLAVYMESNAVPLETAAKETGVGLGLAIDFYNASYLVGLIEKTTETGLALKVAHDTFTDSYLDDLNEIACYLDDSPVSDHRLKKGDKQGFMGKLMGRLKH
jgi:hypothetical protein